MSPREIALPNPGSGTPAGQRHFHEQLGELTALLRRMADLAGKLVADAVDAITYRDGDRVDAIIEADHEIDTLEIRIEELTVSVLALHQPMARDLRFVIGAIKMANDLERIGDHAVNIAQSARRLGDHEASFLPDPTIEDMSRRALKMLHDAVNAFIDSDGPLGRAVCAEDDTVDSLHESVFRILLTHMMADPRTITPALELLLVSRNLERVADLATNIGEDAVFLAEGKQIKHHFEGARRGEQAGQ